MRTPCYYLAALMLVIGTYRVAAAAEEPVQTLKHEVEIHCLRFSPDGKSLASGDESGIVRLWDIAAGKAKRCPDAHKAAVRCVAFSPDGTQVASACGGDGVRLWQPQAGRVTLLKGYFTCAVFSHDAKLVFCAGNGFEMRDARTGELIGKRAPEYVIYDDNPDMGVLGVTNLVAVASDGRFFASAGGDLLVRLWKVSGATNPEPLWRAGTVNEKARTYPVVSGFGPNEKTIVSLRTGEGVIHQWDVTTGHSVRTFDTSLKDIVSAAITPDGNSLAYTSGDDNVFLFDVRNWKKHASVRTRGKIKTLAISNDGSVIAVGDENKQVTLWRVPGDARK